MVVRRQAGSLSYLNHPRLSRPDVSLQFNHGWTDTDARGWGTRHEFHESARRLKSEFVKFVSILPLLIRVHPCPSEVSNFALSSNGRIQRHRSELSYRFLGRKTSTATGALNFIPVRLASPMQPALRKAASVGRPSRCTRTPMAVSLSSSLKARLRRDCSG